MDISLNIQSQTAPTLPAHSANAVSGAQKSKVVEEPVKVAAVEQSDIGQSDEKRYEAVERAAKSYMRDIFAVSDTKFTIFKDNSGQFVTRFTSLRDGQVTYIPEPDMMRYIESRARQREAMIKIQA